MTNLTTDSKILLAHYCSGRYPAHVGLGLPDDLSDIPPERIAEICVAHAIGAHDDEREYELLRGATEVAAIVTGLLLDEFA